MPTMHNGLADHVNGQGMMVSEVVFKYWGLRVNLGRFRLWFRNIGWRNLFLHLLPA